MYSLVVILAGVSIFFYWRLLKKKGSSLYSKQKNLQRELESLKREFTLLVEKISQKEERNHNILKLYEINRNLAPLLDPQELIRSFLIELKRMRGIEEVRIEEKEANLKDYLCFSLEEEERYIYIRCSDKDLKSQLPYLISQLKLLINRAYIYKKLEKIAITDTLTHIPNRRYFMERYDDEFNRSEKFGFNLSFLMVDIDHFKRYNDNLGHLVGDIILREVARILKENIREIDFIGRFGGEEFSIFLPQTSKEEAFLVAERLREKVALSEIQAYDEKVKLTVSIGLASFPQNSKDRDLLIEMADRALYKAKQKGRNCVFAF